MTTDHQGYLSDTKVSCIILAGGEGRRVSGQDKGLILFKQRPLIQCVIDSIASQSDEIIISANRNLPEYRVYGYKVITDDADHNQGPMAGITAALPHCQHEWVLVIPCDMPYLPPNLIERLYFGIGQSNVCVAEVKDDLKQNHLQLVFLLNKNSLPSLEQALRNNQLKLMRWIKQQSPAVIHFKETECFKNFNYTADFV